MGGWTNKMALEVKSLPLAPVFLPFSVQPARMVYSAADRVVGMATSFKSLPVSFCMKLIMALQESTACMIEYLQNAR